MMVKAGAPIIVTGTHRSGTSLVSALLQANDIFMGFRQDSNHEALFFQHLNQWMLGSLNTGWDSAEAYSLLGANPELMKLYTDYCKRLWNSHRRWQFTGLGGHTSVLKDGTWGWKDPRNTLLLPIWLSLFPQAKVLHVRRHGVDVAASLRGRSRHYMRIAPEKHHSRRFWYPFWPKRGGFVDSPRTLELDSALAIWSAYEALAESYQASLGGRMWILSYEQLLRDPAQALSGLSAFLQRPLSTAVDLNADKAFAFKHSRELLDFAGYKKAELKKFGYGDEL